MGKSGGAALYEQARAAAATGDFEEALAVLDILLKQYPEEYKFQLARAMCLNHLGRRAEALAVCEQLERDHNYAPATTLKARISGKLEVAPTPEAEVATEAKPMPEAEHPKPRRRTTLKVFVGICGLLLVVGTGFALLRGKTDQTPTNTPAAVPATPPPAEGEPAPATASSKPAKSLSLDGKEYCILGEIYFPSPAPGQITLYTTSTLSCPSGQPVYVFVPIISGASISASVGEKKLWVNEGGLREKLLSPELLPSASASGTTKMTIALESSQGVGGVSVYVLTPSGEPVPATAPPTPVMAEGEQSESAQQPVVKAETPTAATTPPQNTSQLAGPAWAKIVLGEDIDVKSWMGMILNFPSYQVGDDEFHEAVLDAIMIKLRDSSITMKTIVERYGAPDTKKAGTSTLGMKDGASAPVVRYCYGPIEFITENDESTLKGFGIQGRLLKKLAANSDIQALARSDLKPAETSPAIAPGTSEPATSAAPGLGATSPPQKGNNDATASEAEGDRITIEGNEYQILKRMMVPGANTTLGKEVARIVANEPPSGLMVADIDCIMGIVTSKEKYWEYEWRVSCLTPGPVRVLVPKMTDTHEETSIIYNQPPEITGWGGSQDNSNVLSQELNLLAGADGRVPLSSVTVRGKYVDNKPAGGVTDVLILRQVIKQPQAVAPLSQGTEPSKSTASEANPPASWQSDWLAFIGELSKITSKGGVFTTEVNSVFEGRNVEWSGVLAKIEQPKADTPGSIELAMPPAELDLRETDHYKMGSLTLSPEATEWKSWEKVKVGDSVTFRTTLSEGIPGMSLLRVVTGVGSGTTRLLISTKGGVFVRSNAESAKAAETSPTTAPGTIEAISTLLPRLGKVMDAEVQVAFAGDNDADAERINLGGNNGKVTKLNTEKLKLNLPGNSFVRLPEIVQEIETWKVKPDLCQYIPEKNLPSAEIREVIGEEGSTEHSEEFMPGGVPGAKTPVDWLVYGKWKFGVCANVLHVVRVCFPQPGNTKPNIENTPDVSTPPAIAPGTTSWRIVECGPQSCIPNSNGTFTMVFGDSLPLLTTLEISGTYPGLPALKISDDFKFWDTVNNREISPYRVIAPKDISSSIVGDSTKSIRVQVYLADFVENPFASIFQGGYKAENVDISHKDGSKISLKQFITTTASTSVNAPLTTEPAFCEADISTASPRPECAGMAMTGNLYNSATSSLLCSEAQSKELRALADTAPFAQDADRSRYLKEFIRILGEDLARRIGVTIYDAAGLPKYVWPCDDRGKTEPVKEVFSSPPAAAPAPAPAPSPESSILFMSDRTGIQQMYIMKPDGSESRRLSTGNSLDIVGNCSPDGKRLVFASNRDIPSKAQIYTANLDGSQVTRLTNHTFLDSAPSWSPDGKKILFESNRDGNFEIYVMDADGGNTTRLTKDPAWDSYAAWAPDGKRIAFATKRHGENNIEIYVMNADGTGAKRLTENTANDSTPAWSPDGASIAFWSNRDGNDEIYVMNADGSGQKRLTSASPHGSGSPSWSPDGTKIAFESNRDGNFEIYVMNTNGADVQRLTNSPSDDGRPVWRNGKA